MYIFQVDLLTERTPMDEFEIYYYASYQFIKGISRHVLVLSDHTTRRER